MAEAESTRAPEADREEAAEPEPTRADGSGAVGGPGRTEERSSDLPSGPPPAPARTRDAARPAERTGRARRCDHHPGVAAIATCARCSRPVCITCAIPVRGSVYGPECLSFVLEEAPPAEPRPIIPLIRGDLLAMLGFGLVVVVSVFPWSRFGGASGPFGAWLRHWSLPAVGTGAIGLIAAAAFRRRPRDPRIECAAYLVLAAGVAAASYLHRIHPPPLSSATWAPIVAMAGAAVAAMGGAAKAGAVLRGRWPAR